MREFYLYAEKPIQRIIKEVFIGFEIHILSKEDIKKKKFVNKNIFFVLNEAIPVNLDEVFFFKK